MPELQAVKKLHPHNAQVKKASKIVIIAERLKGQAAVTETSLTDTAWVAEDNKFTQDQDGLQVLGEMKVQLSSQFWGCMESVRSFKIQYHVSTAEKTLLSHLH